MLVFGGKRIWNFGARTPTIVPGPPARSTEVPTTLGSPPKWRRQYASVRMIIDGNGGGCGAVAATPLGVCGGVGGANASSAVNPRPIATRVPKTLNKLGVTARTLTCS